eukprot:g36456.t1
MIGHVKLPVVLRDLYIRSRLTYQRELRDCCVLCFMETWLTPAIPDCTLQADGFSMHRMDYKVSSDHSTVFLLPAYKQKLKWENSSRKEVQHWSKAWEERLRGYLESVDWTVFKCSAENLDEYATTVTGFISKCVEDCVPKKSIRKMKQRKITDKDTSLPDALNAFYDRFEQNASIAVMPAPTAPDTPVASVTASDVRLVFLGVNPRKTMGPDGDPGRALRSCAGQLVEVFTNIFNLSLLKAKDPTCFQKTIIIPVPKKARAMCLSDHCPVALTSIMKCFERLVIAHINSSLPVCLDPLQFAYQ